MTEEVAVRIAEALERIEFDVRTFLMIFVGAAVAFWFIAVIKD